MLDSMPTGSQALPPSLDEFARRQIKRWLHATHTSQTQLAIVIGRNGPWMSRYLAGEYNADLETLRRIALVFGHTVGTLLTMPVDPDEAETVALIRSLGPDDRQTILKLLRSWTGVDRSSRRRSGKSSRPSGPATGPAARRADK
jgi:transcriptional regulator with XRE-family HTH domain